MRSALALLLLVACLLSQVHGANKALHTLNRIDPRSHNAKTAKTESFVTWEISKGYHYRFISSAAHTESPLPKPEKVNPQTSLEELALYPFAVLEGDLVIECQCQLPIVPPLLVLSNATQVKDSSASSVLSSSGGDMLFKVSISDVTSSCGNDFVKTKTNCSFFENEARKMSSHPFWFTMNRAGEFTGLTFFAEDSKTLRGIKKNLVTDLSMSMPAAGEGWNVFTKFRELNDTRFITRYRVRPFSRRFNTTNKPVDGLIVRKEKVTKRPPVGMEEIPYLKNAWVYMIIGGEIERESGLAPVPTHVASLEQVQLDPLHFRQTSADQSLFILSRLELNLRKIRPVLSPPTCILPFQEHAMKTSDMS